MYGNAHHHQNLLQRLLAHIQQRRDERLFRVLAQAQVRLAGNVTRTA